MRGLSPIKVFLFIIFFNLLIVSIFLNADKMKIKKEEGIPVVYNQKKPVPLPDTPTNLTLEEELAIGEKEGKEEYMFRNLFSIDVDEKGNIYCLDRR